MVLRVSKFRELFQPLACSDYPVRKNQKKVYTIKAVGPSTGKSQEHTTGGIPRWSPTLVLVARFSAYVWQSGRDAQFSLTYGRMC